MIYPPRMTLPPEAAGTDGVPLEFVHWPLYSSVALAAGAAIPRSLDFFSYARGQTVSGAGAAAITATAFHTNMTLANAIPRPKTQVVTGVRVIVLPLDYSTSPALPDDTTGAALGNDDLVDDLVFLSQATHLELRQGEIREVIAPSFLLPARVGMRGPVATSVSNTNAASVWQRRVAPFTDGMGWDLQAAPIVLWNQQFFTASLRSSWATNPSVVDAKLVTLVLDGIQGRELQG